MKQDWERLKLGEFCTFQNGRAFKKNEWTNKGLPIIRIGNLNNSNAPFNFYAGDYEKKIVIEYGDLLFSWSGTVGSSFGAHIWKSEEGLLNQHIYKVGFDNTTVKSDFLFYLLKYITKELEKLVSGAVGLVHVKKSTLVKYEVFVPPLNEQKRIVAKLDECFEAIDKARANVEKNLRKTEELHQSLLFQILYQDSEKWEKSILGESCEFFNGKAHEKAIHTDGNYVVVNSKFISRDGKIKKYTREQMFPLFKNDIVMVMSDVPNGKALAKCYLIEKDNTYSLNQRICAIRSENYIHKYLFYQLNRHRHLLSFNNGENQTNLRKNDILNTPLYIPPFDDQEEVVKKLDEVVSQTKSLESNYQQELDALDELKKSILQKAFNGEL